MDETRQPSSFVFAGLKRVLQTTGGRKRARYSVEDSTQHDGSLQGRDESHFTSPNQSDIQSERDKTERGWSCLLNKIKDFISASDAFLEQTLLQTPWVTQETPAAPDPHASTVVAHNDEPSKDQCEANHTTYGALCTFRNRSVCARCHGSKSSMLDIEDSVDHDCIGSATPFAPSVEVAEQQGKKSVQWADGTKSGGDDTMAESVPARIRLRRKSRRVSRRKANDADSQ